MDRPIRVEIFKQICDQCSEEIEAGTTCYSYQGEIYCKDCWETFLEDLTAECEMEAEDKEVWH